MNDVKRASLVEQTTNLLKEYIGSDEIALGEKLPSEAMLCKKYNISRTTLRESFRFLQAMGYIELFPSKGVFVANKQVTDTSARGWMFAHAHEIKDIFEVRSVVDPLAASLAALRATQTERYAILGIKTLFEDAVSQNNAGAMAIYDEKFHEVIVQASHNTLLIDINKAITQSLRNFRAKTFAIGMNGTLAVRPHNEISDAIMRLDQVAAEQSMRTHMVYNIDLTKAYSEQL